VSAAGRAVHRVTGASGASRTGLATLVEVTAAGSIADAFVAVSLAGTIFFSTSVDQARGRVALFLLVTMAPFALLAPVIGPALDRLQQGRKYLLAGTLVARALLVWGMSAAINDPVTLMPAAFGVLVLQKCFGVVRASVAPRLVPAEITLVAANARSALIALIASSVAAPVAAGISLGASPAWVLRAATIIYFLSVIPALRLPEQVDVPLAEQPTVPLNVPGGRGASRPSGPDDTRPITGPVSRRPRIGALRTLGSLGPVVAEAMRANAVLRALSGYMIFFLAFLLRTGHFGVSHNVALGAMVAAAATGGLVAMGIGSVIGSRAPQVLLYAMLAIAMLVTAGCAWFFGFIAALIVAFTAALGTGLAKLAQDSIVQREISEDVRSSAFAVSETLHQLSWVIGGLAGLLVSMLNNGQVGLAITAAFIAVALAYLIMQRRQLFRLRRAPRLPVHPAETHH
jgi:MFS family permease